MSCKDREMFESTAKLLPLQEKADCPENGQEKQVHLCEELGGKAEHDAAHKALDHIPGGERELVTHLGKKCCDN